MSEFSEAVDRFQTAVRELSSRSSASTFQAPTPQGGGIVPVTYTQGIFLFSRTVPLLAKFGFELAKVVQVLQLIRAHSTTGGTPEGLLRSPFLTPAHREAITAAANRHSDNQNRLNRSREVLQSARNFHRSQRRRYDAVVDRYARGRATAAEVALQRSRLIRSGNLRRDANRARINMQGRFNRSRRRLNRAMVAGRASAASIATAVKFGSMALAAVGVTKALIDLARHARVYADRINEGNRILGYYNANIGTAFAFLDLHDMMRQFKVARGSERTSVDLVHAVDRMHESWLKFDVHATNIQNRLATIAADFSGGFGEVAGNKLGQAIDFFDRLFAFFRQNIKNQWGIDINGMPKALGMGLGEGLAAGGQAAVGLVPDIVKDKMTEWVEKTFGSWERFLKDMADRMAGGPGLGPDLGAVARRAIEAAARAAGAEEEINNFPMNIWAMGMAGRAQHDPWGRGQVGGPFQVPPQHWGQNPPGRPFGGMAPNNRFRGLNFEDDPFPGRR